jgi:hypothetical protein
VVTSCTNAATIVGQVDTHVHVPHTTEAVVSPQESVSLTWVPHVQPPVQHVAANVHIPTVARDASSTSVPREHDLLQSGHSDDNISSGLPAHADQGASRGSSPTHISTTPNSVSPESAHFAAAASTTHDGYYSIHMDVEADADQTRSSYSTQELNLDYLRELSPTGSYEYDRDFILSSASAAMVASSLSLSPSNFELPRKHFGDQTEDDGASVSPSGRSQQLAGANEAADVNSKPQLRGFKGFKGRAPKLPVAAHVMLSRPQSSLGGKGNALKAASSGEAPVTCILRRTTLSLDVPEARHRSGMVGASNNTIAPVINAKVRPRTAI